MIVGIGKRRRLVAVIGTQRERRLLVRSECCMIIHSQKKSVASVAYQSFSFLKGVAYQSYVHARTAMPGSLLILTAILTKKKRSRSSRGKVSYTGKF
jgi:hypothetical protein